MSRQNINLCQQHVTVKQYQFPQASISHSWPCDQPSHIFWDMLPIDRRTDGKGQKKQLRKQSYLTCEAEGAFAGVLWRRWRLTSCNACGSIQTAVWLYQAGIAYVLTKLSNPSWGTNTLQENSMKCVCDQSRAQYTCVCIRAEMCFSLILVHHQQTGFGIKQWLWGLSCWVQFCSPSISGTQFRIIFLFTPGLHE